ncbi:MAG: hypothetical protein GEU94_07815 [Micromonosporaceae bacterium]|nr:hypothetical protein [Micromonosporaceae bacterium]
MVQVSLACQPSPDRLADGSANEDFAFATPDLAAVLDGVTVLPGVETGCAHGPAWHARRLGGHLAAGHTEDPARPLVELLAGAIRSVCDDHGATCDLDHPHTPQSTVCLLRVTEGAAASRAATSRADYLVLSDSSLVFDRAGRIEVVTDLRHLRHGPDARIRDRARRLQALIDKRTRANRPNGYWIAAADPEAARHAVTGAVPLAGPGRLVRAALLTDGASCAVDPYHLMGWQGLLDTVRDAGPHHLISLVRRAEHADPNGERLPRHKRHDDASVIYCELAGRSPSTDR